MAHLQTCSEKCILVHRLFVLWCVWIQGFDKMESADRASISSHDGGPELTCGVSVDVPQMNSKQKDNNWANTELLGDRAS